jgi:hypothetical protein
MNPNNYLIAMLDAYVEWLNAWLDDELEHAPDETYHPPRYTVHTFTDHDPRIVGLVMTGASGGFQRVMVEACVYDGDEGGPTDLTAWFDLNTVHGTNPLIAMVQGFDTGLQFIYRDGKPTNLPGEWPDDRPNTDDEPTHHHH